MNGKRYRDAFPHCVYGCEQKVKKFTAKYLPGHHIRGLKGERNSFYGKIHNEFARRAIAEGQKNKRAII